MAGHDMTIGAMLDICRTFWPDLPSNESLSRPAPCASPYESAADEIEYKLSLSGKTLADIGLTRQELLP